MTSAIDDAPFHPMARRLIRLLGWAAMAAIAWFLFSFKSASSFDFLVGATGLCVALLGAIAYQATGRVWATGVSREALRPYFAGYILGVRMTLILFGIVAILRLSSA